MKEKLRRLQERLPSLRPRKLTGADWELDLSDDDLERSLLRKESSPLLFGYFTPQQVLDQMEQVGILAVLREKGYDNFHAYCGPPPGMPPMSMFEDRFAVTGTAGEKTCQLVEIKSHWGLLQGPPPVGSLRALIWDWLSFQHPLGEFTPDRPPLPGQEHPGLGVFHQATQLLVDWVETMDLDAVVEIPEFFHNAVLYARKFQFFEPAQEGWFQALVRDLLPAGLARASWALHRNQVVDGSGERVGWRPAEQVLALKGPIREYLASTAYQEIVAATAWECRFRYTDTPTSSAESRASPS